MKTLQQDWKLERRKQERNAWKEKHFKGSISETAIKEKFLFSKLCKLIHSTMNNIPLWHALKERKGKKGGGGLEIKNIQNLER